MLLFKIGTNGTSHRYRLGRSQNHINRLQPDYPWQKGKKLIVLLIFCKSKSLGQRQRKGSGNVAFVCQHGYGPSRCKLSPKKVKYLKPLPILKTRARHCLLFRRRCILSTSRYKTIKFNIYVLEYKYERGDGKHVT